MQAVPQGLAVEQAIGPLGCVAGAARKRIGQIRHDEVARAGGLQRCDRGCEAVGGRDDVALRIGRPRPTTGLLERKGDVIAARTDQVESVRIGASAVGCQIIADLHRRRNCGPEVAGLRIVDRDVFGAGGGEVCAALIGRCTVEPEVACQRLAAHQAGTAGRLARSGSDCGRPKAVVERAARPWGRKGAVIAAVDRAVAEADELVERLSHGRRVDEKQASGESRDNGGEILCVTIHGRLVLPGNTATMPAFAGASHHRRLWDVLSFSYENVQTPDAETRPAAKSLI